MKKTLILLLTIVLCLCCAAAACAAAAPAGAMDHSPAPLISPAPAHFVDVAPGAWYAPAVEYCLERGVIQGTSATAFSPDSRLSRAMVVTMLWRVDGEPASAFAPDFRDAVADTWYSQAVAWAAGKGIVEGYGNGLFGVSDPVTREQLAAILHRYAGSPAATSTAGSATISTWARPAVNWAQGSGLFAGIGNDMRNMTAPATRAETAVTIYHFLNLADVTQIEVIVGETVLTATLVDNASATAFAELLAAGPLTVEMSDYGGFEKVGDLPQSLARTDERITTAPGDIILYQGDQITVYYAENTWDFTRLGRINGVTQAELKSVLGAGDATITFRLREERPATGGTLVAYFSCTGNTRAVASHIAALSGADLYEITPETPYTEADLNYRDGNSRSTREQNDPAARPALSGQTLDMAGYDVIFLGYPIWHGQAPRIISTFLESHDFSGKTVVPFCTSGSSGIGSSATNLQALAPDSAVWLEGRRFSPSAAEDELKTWLDGLDLPNATRFIKAGINAE